MSRVLFPPPESADENGLVAIGGDLRPERLLVAYANGIFPWPHDGFPLLWFSPDPRTVIEPRLAHVGRSLRKRIRHCDCEVRADTAFDDVVRACSTAPRPGQEGTWITAPMIEAYSRLHALGYAHSVECWMLGRLAGGLYGVSLGGGFFGESMFAKADDASKIAMVTLLGNLAHWGFDLLDCQVSTPHVERFGAQSWTRARFLDALRETLKRETRRGPWVLPLPPRDAMERLH